jgi:hypothetical protein
VDLGERRGRKRRKRDTFEGLPAGELTKVEPPTEDEGVRVIAEPEPETEPEPEPETVAEPAPEPPTDEATASDEANGPEAPESPVDDLFARLRAESTDEETGDTATEAASTDEQGTEGEATEDETPEPADPAEEETEAEPEALTPFTERDALLDPIDKELGRRLKRALADEQNEVLDLLRRAKPKGVDDLLPTADDHAGRWVLVVSEVLTQAATAGATWGGGKPGPIDELADELARSLTAPLRDRIDRSFSAADGNLDDVADRVRALYREWKGQRLTDTSRHYSAAAYARGLFDATGGEVEVHWVVDPLGGRCPDCDDNVLGGNVAKGTEFPTGHACAPAHPGCRCLVLAADG